ncbi:hypothetical protein [Caulobacter segnis]
MARLAAASTHTDAYDVMIGAVRLRIPCRVYVDRGALEAGAPDVDPVLIDALLTRHHNGFVRAEALARLMTAAPDWAPAYVVPLVGEYVVEIIEQIEVALTEQDAPTYGAFGRANPGFMTLTRQRVTSYWDCYWRGRWRREDYPGARVLARVAAF